MPCQWMRGGALAVTKLPTTKRNFVAPGATLHVPDDAEPEHLESSRNNLPGRRAISRLLSYVWRGICRGRS